MMWFCSKYTCHQALRFEFILQDPLGRGNTETTTTNQLSYYLMGGGRFNYLISSRYWVLGSRVKLSQDSVLYT